MNHQMTPQQALQILDVATSPAANGRLTRADYINIQTALNVLQTALEPVKVPDVPDAAPEKP